MNQRLLRLILPVLLTLTFQGIRARGAEPIVYIEAEAGEGAGSPAAMGGTSGGKILRYIAPQFRRTLPLVLKEPITKGRSFVRYGRAGKKTDPGALMKVGIGPVTAKTLEDPAVTQLEPFTLAPTGTWETWKWASTPLPALQAGTYNLFLYFPNQEVANLDVVGLLPVRNDVQLEPSNTVSDNILVGGLIVKSFGSDHVGNLLLDKEALGKDASEITFELELENILKNEPLTASVTWEMSNDLGTVQKLPPVSIVIPAASSLKVPIKLKAPGYGWHGLRATIVSSYDGQVLNKTAAFGVLYPPHDGLRPDSQFGLSTGNSDGDHVTAALLGAKWRRGIPDTHPNNVNPSPGVFWDAARIQTARDGLKLWKDRGILCLGYIDYNTKWNVRMGKDGKPMQNLASPPKDMKAHAEMVYNLIKPFKDEVKVWELWNEPWGHYWQGGTADEFREMTRTVWDRIKPEMPEIEFISGSYYTTHLQNLIYAQGAENGGFIDGSATHPYGKPGMQTLVSTAIEASMNQLWSKGKGKAGIWVTEFGTAEWEFTAHPPAERPFMVARSLAPIILLQQVAAGKTPVKTFWFTSTYGRKSGANDGFEIWNGTSPKPAAVAYSVMTHWIEDSQFQEDLWIGSKNGFALLYQRPDKSHVVAVWPDRASFLGPENTKGTLSLPALDFEAIDYLGRPVGKNDNGTLVIPAQTWQTTYLVSKQPAAQIRSALEAAVLDGWPALRVNPQPFTMPVSQKPPLVVCVENLQPRTCDATVRVKAPAGFVLEQESQNVTSLKPGEVRDLIFPLKETKPDATNRYQFSWASESSHIKQTGSRDVQAAVVTHGTPVIDGNLTDWKAAVPVSILNKGPLADWGKDAPAMLVGGGYQFQAMWDENFFYVAARIPDIKVKSTGGTGDITNSDSLQFAFHVLDKNPDNLLLDNPFYQKGLACDVDYEFALGQFKPASPEAAATASATAAPQRGDGGMAGSEGSATVPAEGLLPSIYRLTAPGTRYQHPSAYLLQNPQTKPPLGRLEAGLQPGKDGSVAVRYDENSKQYTYEAAIPWANIPEVYSKLKDLQTGQMAAVDFAFLVNDYDGWRRITTWQEETGETVLGGYGYAPRIGTPRWTNDYPLQLRTAWGFTR